MVAKGFSYKIYLFLFLGFFASRLVFADLPPGYEDLSAPEKENILLNNILSEEWNVLPPLSGEGWSSIISSLKSAFNLGLTFSHESDELEYERPKIVHAYGVSASFRLEVINNKYSGLLNSDSIGILRLSLAADPASIGSFTPGMALKFLVDGHPSQNLLVMNNVEGQGSNTNWFNKPFSNHIPEPTDMKVKFLMWIFSFIHNPANELSVNHLASIDINGQEVTEIKAPEQLIFVPSDDVKDLIPPSSRNDFRVDLSRIKSGTTLYYVMAKNADGSDLEQIGNLVLTSDFIASRYADKRLFFRHAH